MVITGCGTVTSGDEPDAATNTPAYCQSNADCTDDVFCNGEEVCDPSSLDADDKGCVAAASPCADDETCDEDTQACLTECDVKPDADGDGVDGIACGGTDCDDTNDTIYPGATEVCDPMDVDEDCDPVTKGTEDVDDDDELDYRCEYPDGTGGTTHGLDCDDSKPGYLVGDWAHCGECGKSCAAREACVEGACVPARRVFISSTGHAGDMGGLAGIDAFCQGLADAAALGGTWKGFAADSTTSVVQHLEHATDPYMLLDGTLIAKNFTDLTDGSIAAKLSETETRQRTEPHAWTGTRSPDQEGLSSCSDWTSKEGGCTQGGPCGVAGESNLTDEHWDGFYVYVCGSGYHFYCIEQ